MITQTVSWKARPLSSFYLYGVIFLVFLVASPFYAWGIHELLDKYEETSKTRNSFSFGDEIVIITGIFLAISSYSEITRESAKSRRFAMSMMACDAFLDHVRNRIDLQKAANSDSAKNTSAPSLCSQTCDLLTMHVMLPIFFLWEAYQIRTPNFDDLYDLVACMDSNNKIAMSVSNFFRTNMIKGATASATLIGLIEQRVMHLEKADVIRRGTAESMAPSVASVKSSFSEFKVTRSSMVLWIISIANFIIALLYFLLSPFLLWFSQGWFMLYTYPVIFLLVGGIVSYRWYIGDVILSPNTLHTKASYDVIFAMCGKADFTLAAITNANQEKHRQICSKFFSQ